MPLRTKQRELRKVGVIAETLGEEGLPDLNINIPKNGKVMAQQAVMLSRVEKELPSMPDVAKAGDIKLQEMMESTAKSMEDLIAQLDDQMQFKHPLCKLLGLDKEQRSIWN